MIKQYSIDEILNDLTNNQLNENSKVKWQSKSQIIELDLQKKGESDLDLDKLDKKKIVQIIQNLPTDVPMVKQIVHMGEDKETSKEDVKSHVLNRFIKRQKKEFKNLKFINVLKQYYQQIIELDDQIKMNPQKYIKLKDGVIWIYKNGKIQYKLVIGRGFTKVKEKPYLINSDNFIYKSFQDLMGKEELELGYKFRLTDEVLQYGLSPKNTSLPLKEIVVDLQEKPLEIPLGDKEYIFNTHINLMKKLYSFFINGELEQEEQLNILIDTVNFIEPVENIDDLKRLVFKTYHWILTSIYYRNWKANREITFKHNTNVQENLNNEGEELIMELTDTIFEIIGKELRLINTSIINNDYLKEKYVKDNKITLKTLNDSIQYTIYFDQVGKIKEITIDDIDMDIINQSIIRMEQDLEGRIKML